MALASYYRRNSTAASQILGLDNEAAFLDILRRTSVGIHVGDRTSLHAEGRFLVDLLVRLFARLYPNISLTGGVGSDGLLGELSALAKEINPAIQLSERIGDSRTVIVGPSRSEISDRALYAGSNSWVGCVSPHRHVRVGRTNNPLGPAAAACVAAGAVFNGIFMGQEMSGDVTISTLLGVAAPKARVIDIAPITLAPKTAIVGLGGVGNALIWALARMPIEGEAWLVDAETVDLGNLQRYLLASRKDVGRKKVNLAGSALRSAGISVHRYAGVWEDFVAETGFDWDDVVVSVDSAVGRRHVQSSLPAWIANAWTQATEAAVSVHPEFGGDGACLNCLYVRDAIAQHEDQRIAEALGLSSQLIEVRRLLATNERISKDLLVQVAAHFGVKWARVQRFMGLPLRQLYSDGVCGRAILPIGATPTAPKTDAHVPLAHQSALAGILLASALALHRSGLGPDRAQVTRTDVIRPVLGLMTLPVLARTDGLCICNDPSYRSVYRRKHSRGEHDGTLS